MKATTATAGAVAVLSATGDQVGVIGPFVMADASQDPVSGEARLSASVAVSVVERAGSMVVQIPVKPFADANVQFPVTVTGSFTVGLDMWGRGWKGTNPADHDFRVGVLDKATRARGFVRFPVNKLGPGTVSAATLSVWKDWTGSCSNKLSIVEMAEGWSKNPTNNGFPGPKIGPEIAYVGVPCPQSSLHRLDVAVAKSVVQGWTTGPNNGIGFKTRDDTGADLKIEWLRLCSPEECTGGSTKANVPVLSVTYAPPSALTPTGLDLSPRVGMVTRSENPTISASFPATPSPGVSPYPLTGIFRVYEYPGARGALVCQQQITVLSAGEIGTPACPPGQSLQSGHNYVFTAQGVAAGGASPESPQFGPFLVDLVPPPPVHISATAIDATTGAVIPLTAGTWSANADPTKPVSFTIQNDPTVTDLVAYQIREDALQLPDSPAKAGAAMVVPWTSGPGWHVFQVATVDHAGHVSVPTVFEFGVGSAVLTAPGVQSRSAKYFPVGAEAPLPSQPAGVTAQVLWKPPGDTDFSVVSEGLTVGSSPWSGAVTVDSHMLRLPDGLTWDISAVAGKHAPPITAPSVVQVKARFTIPGPPATTVDTNAVAVQWVPHAFGGNFATEDVGVGQVSLSTGELSMSATDAALPGPGGVSAGRSWLSYEGSAPNALFGPGWVPSVPQVESAAGDAQITISPDSSSIVLTYPDGWVDTYAPGTPPGGKRAGAGQTYIGSGETAQDGGYLTLNGDTLSFTEPSGLVTTWTRSGSVWTVAVVSSPTVGESSRTFWTPATAGSDGVVATVTGRFKSGTSAAQCATLGSLAAARSAVGCRILWWTIAKTSTPKPAGTSGDFPGQVSGAWIRVWDGTGTAANDIQVSDYTYTADGLLDAVWDPRIRPNLVTRYSYTRSSSPAGLWQLTQVTPASTGAPGETALIPFALAYDELGRLNKVTRAQPTGGSDAVTYLVYGINPGGDGNALPRLTPDEVDKWDQPISGAPISGVAVFDPNPNVPNLTPPAPSDMTNLAWAYADITYLNGQGAAVNTATVGANQWLIDTVVYDYTASAGGQVVSALSAANRVLALGSSAECLAAGVAPIVCAQTTSGARALGLSTITVYDPARPGVVTDTYGPVTQIVPPAGSRHHPAANGLLAARTHTHTVYNEGAPSDVVTSGATLPTTVTTGAWPAGTGITPPRTPSSSAGDLDVRTSRTGYDVGLNVPGAVAGWSQRAATSNSVTVNASQTITTTSAIDATGFTLGSKQPMSSGGDAGTTRAWPYSAGTATPGAPSQCGNMPGWDGLPCVSGPAAQPTITTLPTATVEQYSLLLAPTRTTEVSGPATRTTTITYDNAGRPLTTTITGQGAGDSVLPTTVVYDQDTGAVTQTRKGDQVVSTSYDTWNRPVTQTDTTGNAATTVYTIASTPALVSDSYTSTTYVYDTPRTSGQLGEQRGLATTQTSTVSGTTRATWQASYSTTGGPAVVTLPNGVLASSAYDVTGSLRSLAYTTSTGQPLLAPMTQAFNTHSQVVSSTGPTGPGSDPAAVFVSSAGYDGAGRLIADSMKMGATTTNRSYGWNLNSDRTSMVSAVVGGQSITQTATFNDADMALTTAVTGGQGSSTYTYDRFGRTMLLPAQALADESEISYTWYTTDRVHTQTAMDEGKPYSHATSWDPLNRQVVTRVVVEGGSGTVTYAYADTGDAPVAMTAVDSGGDREQVVNVRGITGGLGLTVDQNSAAGDAPPSWWPLPTTGSSSTDTQVDVMLANPHGDMIATAPASGGVSPGDVSAVAIYEPFGAPIQEGGVDIYTWEGAAQRSSFNIGKLISMGARLYNPGTGRFLTTDPVPGGNANRSTYPTDPINGQDLTGEYVGGNLVGPICISASCMGAVSKANKKILRQMKELQKLYGSRRTSRYHYHFSYNETRIETRLRRSETRRLARTLEGISLGSYGVDTLLQIFGAVGMSFTGPQGAIVGLSLLLASKNIDIVADRAKKLAEGNRCSSFTLNRLGGAVFVGIHERSCG